MPRAPNDRPSRRLDAFLTVLRKHRVRDFEALKLEGVGEGLKWRFLPEQPQQQPAPQLAAPRQPGITAPDPDLNQPARSEPVDELALVEAGLQGPVPEERPS